MKTYVVKVTPEESAAVQKALFSVGIVWSDGDKCVSETNEPYLHIDGCITFSRSWNHVCECITDDGKIPVTHQWLIDHAAELPGAKPEKMITLSNGKEVSESTIMGLLRQAGEE